MERVIRWLVNRFMPGHHLKLKPKRASKPRAPRVKKAVQEKTPVQPALDV